jgi:ribosomal protein S18 acetylase RimI-like enzyme
MPTPVANFAVKQDARRSRRMNAFLKILFEACLPHGELYVSDGLEGGAFWIPPGGRETGLRANLRFLPNLVRAAGLARVPGLVSAIDEVDKKHPHEPHFYLPMIGIDPPYQGRGIGSALMRPVLERCDREGIPAYLESSNERNVALYERNGFRV